MKKWRFLLLLIFSSIPITNATPENNRSEFYFLAIDQPAHSNSKRLKNEFAKIRRANPAFIVLNGIKSKSESCHDDLFLQRKNLINDIPRPVIVSLTSEDWANCKNSAGKSLAVERLIRLREILFENELSLGSKPIHITRQSLSNRFSAYVENAYWHQGSILFATLHLPANNNHYIAAAGRNNEFEDRMIANKNWLDLLFRLTTRQHYKGIVLFSDGNPLNTDVKNSRDGYYEIRQKLNALVSRYPGRVLLIHGDTLSKEITWKGRLGTMGLGSSWSRINVNSGTSTLFKLESFPQKSKMQKNKSKRTHSN